MLSALLAFCVGNPPVIGRFSSQIASNSEHICLLLTLRSPWTTIGLACELRCPDTLWHCNDVFFPVFRWGLRQCHTQNNRWILTHWSRVRHICISKLAIIGSDNGLSPWRRQAIIWINARILLIGPLGTNFSEIYIEILKFSFKKMRLKVSSAKRRPFCLGLNVLTGISRCIWVKPYCATDHLWPYWPFPW